MKKLFIFYLFLFPFYIESQTNDSVQIRALYDFNLTEGSCYENLRSLCKDIGHRLSGSNSAENAVKWAEILMNNTNLDTVYLQQVLVPYWERGNLEKVYWKNSKGQTSFLNCSALGGSVGTNGILNGEVVEITNWAQLKDFGRSEIEGKIVFLNRVMNPTFISTGNAYGSCVDQRHLGASRAAEFGAIGVIVRSMSLKHDKNPHTGSMTYLDYNNRIPAAAISTKDAHDLSLAIKENKLTELAMELSCLQHEDVISYNVIGEIKGTELPEEIILVGGHLDSWDIGEGAHDDGAGVVQSLQVLETFKKLELQPKRTLRCVMYMNEENGNRGGKHYAGCHNRLSES